MRAIVSILVSMIIAAAWGFGIVVGVCGGVWFVARATALIVPAACERDCCQPDLTWLPAELR
ncbi:MAG: hypothetical protein QXS54_02970 [Candidatus Methanomethylicaceae archaeon]